MKMKPGQRALDKIYKRRDRYEIPEWQRGEVWNTERKQQLIDSILRGWKLPKFYFLRLDDDELEVVDGQQRLAAVYEFFANELNLSEESTGTFGGPFYKDLKPKFSDAFDDFEIEFDEIEEASEEELKQFFQRLQQGLPLSSSEKLNSVHSKLRDFCRSLTKHGFFVESVALGDTRLAHFDIATKVATIEVEGIEASLRFEDVKAVFESQKNFSTTSAVAKRIKGALDFLHAAFPKKEQKLKNRTIVQSVMSLACRCIETGKAGGLESHFGTFIEWFLNELARQVELGQAATDYDFIRFQKSINANVKAGARIRQEILLRKAFLKSSAFADAFEASTLLVSGIHPRVRELADSIATHINRLNTSYAAIHGEDMFKATNKTTKALRSIEKPVKDFGDYSNFVGNLYSLFKESVGQRLSVLPASFVDVNTLRTDLQHDVDHGDAGKVRKKRKNIGTTFERYSGLKAPELLDPSRFVLVQVNLLSALELDLRNLPIS
ncbi:DUF262 domain-containing protein [Paraburkholderia sediminicola]|uniref:DUF262 domain-containing protein n=1 Tax=Paraburkholderia sediminicola TaxID=458836 RepID=UPI0038BAAF41